LAVALNSRITTIPPLGKFLSPFHGFWQNAEKEAITFSEEINLPGLSAPVQVYYDEMYIPHIFASNNKDLHTVQGYVAARDRLWQMDFLSRVVTGRLSEVLGESMVDADKYLRRIGMKKMTQDITKVTLENPEIEEIIIAYTNGVNAYIDQLNYADYPVEFKLLNYSPERWTNEKSHLAYALLSQTLSMSEADLENTNALALLGRDIFDLLYPDQLGNLDPIISKDRKWDFEPIKVKKPDIEFPLIKTRETIEKPDPLNGSNNFAVAPSKSNSGHVLLANEPDLSLSLPSIWHAEHLHSDKKNVMGVTVPGTPVILIGFNDSIAWGVTNSPRDQVDWYSVTFRDQSRNEYLYNNQWFKTSKTIEKIKTAEGDIIYDTIVYTHQGPVVYDRNYKSENGKNNYAMQWIAHYPSSTFKAMNKVNEAKNYSEFTKALSYFQGPPQNFIFGSVRGDIAMWLPGKFPVKWEEQGKFLMDGSDPQQEWKDFIPFDHYMYQKNPERGFVSSANQHQVDTLYPYYVYDHHFEYNRGRRINDRLRTLNNIIPKDMMKLQNDNFNYTAAESLPMMLSYLDSSSLNQQQLEVYNKLKNWDYFNEEDLLAPTYYQLWWDILYDNLWDEFDTVSIAIQKPHTYVTVHLLKTDSSLAFTDVLKTPKKETTQDLIQLSFNQSLDSLNSWQSENGDNISWSTFKNTTIRHYLRLEPFSRSDIKIGGYKSIVNAAAKTHGPSWRMVVELDPAGIKAWGVYPGSETGNPGNPAYAHMIDNWASGTYYPLLFGNNLEGSDKVIFTQTIKP